MNQRKTHPFAYRANDKRIGFDLGTYAIHGGDRIVCRLNGKHGHMDEALHDGEALVSYDDGTFDMVKWGHLVPEEINPKPHKKKDSSTKSALKEITPSSGSDHVPDVSKMVKP